MSKPIIPLARALPRLYSLELQIERLAQDQRVFHLGLAAHLVTRGLNQRDDLELHCQSAVLLQGLDELRAAVREIRRDVSAWIPASEVRE